MTVTTGISRCLQRTGVTQKACTLAVEIRPWPTLVDESTLDDVVSGRGMIPFF